MRSTFRKLATLAATALTIALVSGGFGSPATATEPVPSIAATVTLPSDVTTTTDDRSFFEKAGDFASDNATWFIVGIIVLAAVLAAIFILRGRRKSPATPAAGTAPATGAAAGAGGTKSAQGTPSAAEIKRRRRAAMQRAREEERLRRKAGLPAGAKPAQALDPVAAEKQAARTGTPQQPKAPVPPVSPEAPTEVVPGPGGIGAGAAAGGIAAAGAGAAAGAIAAGSKDDDAEARLREKVEEIKAGQAATAPSSEAPVTPPVEQPTVVTPPSGAPVGPGAVAGGAAAAAGAAAAGAIGSSGGISGEAQAPPASQAVPGNVPVPQDLAEAETRIRADREARDRTLAEAEQRLRLVEERAEAAERRAAFAEQLAELKAEEGEQERRLREVMERMDRAEERARQAELRAESAERVASDALRGGRGPTPPPAAPAVEADVLSGPQSQVAPPAPAPSGSVGSVNINTASFEELRSAEFSVTQATRVLAYRERFGGYGSVEDLARVPGFSPETIAALRDRISI